MKFIWRFYDEILLNDQPIKSTDRAHRFCQVWAGEVKEEEEGSKGGLCMFGGWDWESCASTLSLRRRKAPGEEQLNEAISMSGLRFLPQTHMLRGLQWWSASPHCSPGRSSQSWLKHTTYTFLEKENSQVSESCNFILFNKQLNHRLHLAIN